MRTMGKGVFMSTMSLSCLISSLREFCPDSASQLYPITLQVVARLWMVAPVWDAKVADSPSSVSPRFVGVPFCDARGLSAQSQTSGSGKAILWHH